MNNDDAGVVSESPPKKLLVLGLLLGLIGILEIGLLITACFWSDEIIGYGFSKIVSHFCGYIVHSRPNDIEAEPLLELEIPVNADLNQWGNWEADSRMSPIGKTGANIFIKRFDSRHKANAIFEHECEKGWIFEDENRYNRSRLKYEGEGGNRYCTSPVLEWRYDTSALCRRSGEYDSYVIFQKKDIIIAIFEYEKGDVSQIGTSTNKAIQELVDTLRQ